MTSSSPVKTPASRPRRASDDSGAWQRMRAALARVRDRMARSRHVFLLGVVVACAIEVVVDWNSTLLEINNLRDRMRERGTSYAAILDKSAAIPIVQRDIAMVERLSAGVFDDDDAIFVRYADRDGKILFEHLDPRFGSAFAARRGETFQSYYAYQLDRDIGGMLHDPTGLAARMAGSRHRDFIQAWNDFEKRVVARFVKPEPKRDRADRIVLYQDRLRTPTREHDDAVTYALATVTDESKSPVGVVVVAFSMERTNAAIRGKLLKGLGLVAFFVGLLVVQNVFSRRDKIKLLEQETRQRHARAAVRAALPKSEQLVAGAVDQTESGVDGMIWDRRRVADRIELILVDPLGNDAVTASIALRVVATYRKLEEELGLDAVLRTIVDAAAEIPLARPIGALVLRVDLRSGAIEGVGSRMATLRARSGDVAWVDCEIEGEGLVTPTGRVSGTLPAGATLVAVCDGVEPKRVRVDGEAVIDFFERARGEDLAERARDAVTWARGKWPASKQHDLAVAAIARDA